MSHNRVEGQPTHFEVLRYPFSLITRFLQVPASVTCKRKIRTLGIIAVLKSALKNLTELLTITLHNLIQVPTNVSFCNCRHLYIVLAVSNDLIQIEQTFHGQVKYRALLIAFCSLIWYIFAVLVLLSASQVFRSSMRDKSTSVDPALVYEVKHEHSDAAVRRVYPSQYRKRTCQVDLPSFTYFSFFCSC